MSWSGVLAIVFLLFPGLAAAAGTAASAMPVTASPKCASAAHHQLDFWIGDWDAYEVDEHDKLVARNRVDPILGGCVLHELYEQNDGLVGESYSIYDAARRVWHQTWVTNRGLLLVLEGRFDGGHLVLTGSGRGADGRPMLERGVWQAAAGGVRETATASTDGGKTWTPLFDIMFRPHRPR